MKRQKMPAPQRAGTDTVRIVQEKQYQARLERARQIMSAPDAFDALISALEETVSRRRG